MANRPGGFGITADIEKKKLDKYNKELEQQARIWIEAVTSEAVCEGTNSNEPLGMDEFGEALKNGVILCKLMNVLKPGSIRKINSSKMAFKMMENIAEFLKAAEAYGLSKADSFQTVDLYEKQNVGAVVYTIHALGRAAQKQKFNGPILGPKESSPNKREFTDEQLRAGQGHVSLQAGSNKGASQAGQNFGKQRMIID